jgi:integrase
VSAVAALFNEAKNKLKDVLRDYEDGLAIAPADYTVARAVKDWLTFGLAGRDRRTVETCRILCDRHVIPALGARKLRDLSAEDVDGWLAEKSKKLSTRTLQSLHSCLNRSVRRAMARDKVKRNVVELCSVPKGQEGRPSKALTLAQAEAMLKAAEGNRVYAYVVLSLLTGARTLRNFGRSRGITSIWTGIPTRTRLSRPTSPYGARSVWGETPKPRKSRRTIALPARAIDALHQQRRQQERERAAAGDRWIELGLVFASQIRPVVQSGAIAMDRIFSSAGTAPRPSTAGRSEPKS